MKRSKAFLVVIMIFALLVTTGAYMRINGNFQDGNGVSLMLTGTLSNLGVGTSTFGTNADGVISLDADGVVPSSSPAGVVQVYATDSSDGATNSTIAFRMEQAVEAAVPTVSHQLQIWINGTEYLIGLDPV